MDSRGQERLDSEQYVPVARAATASSCATVPISAGHAIADLCSGSSTFGAARATGDLALQRGISNGAVARMIAGRQSVPPDTAPAPAAPDAAPPAGAAPAPDAAAATDADKLVESYTTLRLLDEEGLGQALAGSLPQREALANAVLDKVHDTDTDDVSFEITKALVGKLSSLSRAFRLRLIKHMVHGVVTDDEEGQIAELWKSFGPPTTDPGADFGQLPAVVASDAPLWRKSLDECDQLVDYVTPIVKEFKRDVKIVALMHLKENRRAVRAEAGRFGIEVTRNAAPPVEKEGYLEDMMAIAARVQQIIAARDELLQIVVGYNHLGVPQKGVKGGPLRVRFNPEARPEIPPTGEESPPLPTWQRTNERYQEAVSAIAGFANLYPSIYVLMQQGRLDEVAATGDATKAKGVIEETLRTTHEKIIEAQEKISGGGSDVTLPGEDETPIGYSDLVPIHSQLLAGAGIADFSTAFPWQEPLFGGLAKDDLDKDKNQDFWTELGLDMVTAAALIAAPFTGGATAAILVGGAVGIDAGRAAVSWQKYADLKDLGQTGTRDELALVSQGQVSGALTAAILSTLALFLDAFGARAGAGGAPAITAVEGAEAALKAQMEAQARKRLGTAAKEAATTGVGVGAAIAGHELEEEPHFATAAHSLSIPFPEAESSPAAVSPKLLRQPPVTPPGGAIIVPGTKAPHTWGPGFETHMEGALRRGEVQGLPQIPYLWPGKYTGSDWGIDFIGATVDRPNRRFELYRFECKYVGVGGAPGLTNPSLGVQYGRDWSENAVHGFLNANYADAVKARTSLAAALKSATGRPVGFDVIEKRLLASQVHVFYPDPADIRRLFGQVLALRRWGTAAHLHGVPLPHR